MVKMIIDPTHAIHSSCNKLSTHSKPVSLFLAIIINDIYSVMSVHFTHFASYALHYFENSSFYNSSVTK